MRIISKKVASVLLIAMLAVGIQMSSFATSSPSLDTDTSPSESESSQEEALSTSESVSESASSESESAELTASTTGSGNINEAPNTGVPVAPMAVAAIGLVSIPVMIGARKKKD